VPFIPPSLLGPSIFLYGSERDAADGANWGGSGFLVGIPSRMNPSREPFTRTHVYAVSNDHVIHSCPVIRLVKANGDPCVLPGTDADWQPHPAGDDIAIRSLGAVAGGQLWCFGADFILSQTDIDQEAIGPGDDCLMIGRYINQEHRQFDRPAVRFGNLAMMPELINQPQRPFEQESFLVDMRSQPGFSGSPVLVYFQEPGWRNLRPPSARVEDGPEAKAKALEERVAGRPLSGIMGRVWLLGIDWGHLPVWDDVFDGNRKIGRMRVSTGMAGVVPAWKLFDLLHEKGMMMARDKAEKELTELDEEAAGLDVRTVEEFAQFEDLTRKLIHVAKR
jgi:hypothetical protein